VTTTNHDNTAATLRLIRYSHLWRSAISPVVERWEVKITHISPGDLWTLTQTLRLPLFYKDIPVTQLGVL